MTARTPTYLKSVFETGDTPQGADYSDIFDSFLPVLATGKQTLDINLEIGGDFTASGDVNSQRLNVTGTASVGNLYATSGAVIGDPGTENAGINVGGTTYQSTFKVSDIDGNNLAQTILHRHSTTLEPLILGARCNSNSAAHVTVTSGQNLFSIYAVGWADDNYKIFGQSIFSTDTDGAITSASSPGKYSLLLTPNGSTTPAECLNVTNDKTTTFQGAVRNTVDSSVAATGTTTAAAKSVTEAYSVLKTVASATNNALIVSKSRSGYEQVIINDVSASAFLFPTSAAQFDSLGNGVSKSIGPNSTLTVTHITSAQYYTR